jgi:predicted ATPase
VLVGSNASGKSNLFDALHLLSRLAEVDLRSAFQGLRGSPDDQFTLFPNDQPSDHIRIPVEMLVDRKVQDKLEQKTELTHTRLRYEIAVAFRTDTYEMESPYVLHESLQSIPLDKDDWSKEHSLLVQNGWILDTAKGQNTFLDTKPSNGHINQSATPLASQTEYLMISLYSDSDGQGIRRISLRTRYNVQF